MSQAKVLDERDMRKVMLYCTAHKHAVRNKTMLLKTAVLNLKFA
jgi:hypothetical protein